MKLHHLVMLPAMSGLGSLSLFSHAIAEETTDAPVLPAVEVTASADASAEGLSEAYAGGQVAEGGRVGLLGTQDIMDTPFVVTSYTQDYIQNQQAESVSDVLANDPAVRVARGFGNFQQAYFVRGFVIYSDDIAYNGLYGLLPRQYLATEVVERVEVLRGGNAFLNGAAPGGSGLGGAVNIMPKRAGSEPLTQFTLGTQTGGQAYVATDLARRSDDGRMGVRVNAATRNGESAVEDSERELNVASVGADFRGDAFRVSMDLGYQNHMLDAAQPSVTIGDGLPIPKAPKASNNIAQPWTYSDEKDLFGTVRAEYDFSDNITGWMAAGAREGEEKNFLANPTTINNAGDSTASAFQNVREDSVLTGELGVRFSFNTGNVGHRVTVSANSFESEAKNAYGFAAFGALVDNIYHPNSVPAPATDFFTGGDMNHPLVTEQIRTSSFAVADQLAFLDERLLVTLGARHQSIEQYSYDYGTGAELENGAYDESRVTPVGGVVYKFSPQVSAYLNYIEGLVKGETAAAVNNGVDVTNPNESLKPYQAKQTELGLKFDRGDLGASIGVFESRKPVSGYNSSNTFVELDDQVNKGLEIMVFGEPAEGFRTLGGISFLRTELQGNEGIGAPRTQANLGLEWDLPALRALTFTGDMIYTSAQYADAANTQKVPDWAILNLGARYVIDLTDTQMLTLRGQLENVTDRDYWASAGGFPNAGYLTLGEPRTLTVSATVNF